MIHIPNSLNHPNILDEEIEAYYAIKCVKDADYDFEKQFDKMITEYVDEIKFPSKGARRSFKSQLKKMVLVDKPKNSKKYSAFVQWRLRKIEFHKNKQRDLLMKKPKDTTIDVDKLLLTINEKDKLIEQLMKENEELKAKLAVKPKIIYYQESDEEEEVIFSDEEPEPEQPEPEQPETEEESEAVEPEVIDVLHNVILQIEKPYFDKDTCIQGFFDNCNKKVDDYHKEFMDLKKDKTDKEIRKITNDINQRFLEEVIEFYLNKLDDIFDLPMDEYEKLQEKAREKLLDAIMYFSE
jgi:hypothetical protein